MHQKLSLGQCMAVAIAPDMLFYLAVMATSRESLVYNGSLAGKSLPFTYTFPVSHSLGVMMALALTLAVLAKRYSARDLTVALGLALSHFILDGLSHRDPLPLVPWAHSPGLDVLGWGLVNKRLPLFFGELTLFFAGYMAYDSITHVHHSSVRSLALHKPSGYPPLHYLIAAVLFIHCFLMFGPVSEHVDPRLYTFVLGLLTILPIFLATLVDQGRVSDIVLSEADHKIR